MTDLLSPGRDGLPRRTVYRATFCPGTLQPSGAYTVVLDCCQAEVPLLSSTPPVQGVYDLAASVGIVQNGRLQDTGGGGNGELGRHNATGGATRSLLMLPGVPRRPACLVDHLCCCRMLLL